MKKIYILFILSLCDPFAFGQQSAMLESTGRWLLNIATT